MSSHLRIVGKHRIDRDVTVTIYEDFARGHLIASVQDHYSGRTIWEDPISSPSEVSYYLDYISKEIKHNGLSRQSVSSRINRAHHMQNPWGLGPVAIGIDEAAPVTPIKHSGTCIVGEILAYRCFFIKGGFLASQSAGTIWAPGEAMTAKTVASQEAQNANTGVYGFKLLRDAIKHGNEQMGSGPRVYGSILMYGEAVEHELGWRSQYAMLRKIEGVLQAPAKQSERSTLRKLNDKYRIAA